MNTLLSVEIRIILNILTIFLFILFSIFLLTRKKGNRHSYRMLAGFLLASAILLIQTLIEYFHMERISPHLWEYGFPFVLFFSPALYLYTKSVTRNETRMRWIDNFHFIPFIILYIVMYVVFYRFDAITKLEVIGIYNRFGNEEIKLLHHPIIVNLDKTFFISSCFCEIQFIIYAILSLILLNQYRSNIKQYYSAIEKINLSWLNLVIYGFIGWRLVYLFYMIWSYYLMRIFSTPTLNNDYLPFLLLVVKVGFLFFASALVYKALTTPIVTFSEEALKKYQTSPLNESDKKLYLQKIDAVMKTEKPYRDPLFTLQDLAKKTSVPIRYVSQVLNETLNQKFYDYVNQYRVEEIKKMLSDPSQFNKNITEIFYEAGFNAKSVFNKAFKKHVGITPREFREQWDRKSIQNVN